MLRGFAKFDRLGGNDDIDEMIRLLGAQLVVLTHIAHLYIAKVTSIGIDGYDSSSYIVLLCHRAKLVFLLRLPHVRNQLQSENQEPRLVGDTITPAWHQ